MATQSKDGLSPRERDVIRLVLAGKSNAQIARTLGMAPGTVKGHLESIFGKYHVSSRLLAALEWVKRRGRAE